MHLLNYLAFAISGSRGLSKKGSALIDKVCDALVKQDIVVVSGNAKGADMRSHYITLKAGGSTILVIAEGMNRFYIKRDLKPVWNKENTLVFSPFKDNEEWSVGRAMQRNKNIVALSNGMLAIEAGHKGGTLNAGMVALKNDLPLFVYGDTEGTDILLEHGAKLLKFNNIKPIFDVFNLTVI